jgi:poly-beta-1,6 N-acetyl-D-glucosamine synthase
MDAPRPGNVAPRTPGRPVFVDPSGRRRRWLERTTVVLSALLLAIAAGFTISLFRIAVLPHVTGLNTKIAHEAKRTLPAQPVRAREQTKFVVQKARQKLLAEIAREEAASRARQAKAAALAPPSTVEAPVIVGAFYAVWQEAGIHSLRDNASRINHLFPVWLRVGPNGDAIDTRDWDPALSENNVRVLKICHDSLVTIHPVLANAHEGVFDPARAHLLLSDSVRQARLVRQVHDWLRAHGFTGLNVDLESLAPEDEVLVPAFLERLHAALAPDGLKLSFDLQASAAEDLDVAGIGRACDFVILMGYDQHGRFGGAGPLSAADWYSDALDATLAAIPTSKVVAGIGQYGYDWVGGKPPADALTYQQAISTAADERPDDRPQDVIDFDPTALNATYNYKDDDGREHEVWMLDAVSAANQRMLSLDRGVRGQVLWVLGAEDPDIWGFLDRAHPDARPDSSRLAATTYPFNVDFSGDGELLTVSSLPRAGQRTVDRDSTTGLFTDQSYETFPEPYILQREGYLPKAIALTFDDGPSTPWTGQILDLLARYHVRATFFVIGQNAERHPGLLRRIWAEGHEIGNHTFTHPNLGADPPVPIERVRLELNATQRAIEADVGHSTILFRPPYNADAEPTTREEVIPIQEAAALGYVSVGEYLDPQDWAIVDTDSSNELRPRTTQDIVNSVFAELANQHGNTILLHDGGGDRARTVAALGILIPELERRGYRFVTASELAGVSRETVMPRIAPGDLSVFGVDLVTFELLFFVDTFLYWAFLTAIGLGTLRVLWISCLAIVAALKRRRDLPPFTGTVSVIVPAYNEHRVIARTLHAVLAGPSPPLEVIVVDDGSADGTAEEAEKVAAMDPRIRVLRQENAGKASALNHGIGVARGEIVVCLDADTLFTPTTIPMLVRGFSDPAVGAVAGNVKVGNRINLWTRWQAIEYVSSQNLDRRANALLNSITVVPGAVGAWRKDAVLAAGGFRADTLAEDMDLTWRLRRAGWRLENEPAALAYTEAPASLDALSRQRFRWTYGTLQCLWKHRRAVGRYGWFGRVTLPSLWLFQIAYPALSPVIDVLLTWNLARVALAYLPNLPSAMQTGLWLPDPQALESLSLIATMFAFFFALEFGGAALAYALEKEPPYDLFWLFWQRFVYRQLMYIVVIRSLRQAVLGRRAGWDKLERKGTAKSAHKGPAQALP